MRTQARAAIEAMRKPTDAMNQAARIQGEISALDASHCWHEMIDEALK